MRAISVRGGSAGDRGQAGNPGLSDDGSSAAQAASRRSRRRRQAEARSVVQPSVAATARVRPAPARSISTLRVLGRRPDGYHEIEGLVVFAAAGDAAGVHPGNKLDLVVVEPDPRSLSGDIADNLVLKAVKARSPSWTRVGSAVSCCRSGCRWRRGSAAARPMPPRRCAPRPPSQPHRARRRPSDGGGTRHRRRCSSLPRTRGPVSCAASARCCPQPFGLPACATATVNPRVSVATRDVFTALHAPPAWHRRQPW